MWHRVRPYQICLHLTELYLCVFWLVQLDTGLVTSLESVLRYAHQHRLITQIIVLGGVHQSVRLIFSHMLRIIRELARLAVRLQVGPSRLGHSQMIQLKLVWQSVHQLLGLMLKIPLELAFIDVRLVLLEKMGQDSVWQIVRYGAVLLITWQISVWVSAQKTLSLRIIRLRVFLHAQRDLSLTIPLGFVLLNAPLTPRFTLTWPFESVWSTALTVTMEMIVQEPAFKPVPQTLNFSPTAQQEGALNSVSTHTSVSKPPVYVYYPAQQACTRTWQLTYVQHAQLSVKHVKASSSV